MWMSLLQVNAAKALILMSEHQVVSVKKRSPFAIWKVAYYLRKPLHSTILVICHKHGTLDRRKNWRRN